MADINLDNFPEKINIKYKDFNREYTLRCNHDKNNEFNDTNCQYVNYAGSIAADSFCHRRTKIETMKCALQEFYKLNYYMNKIKTNDYN